MTFVLRQKRDENRRLFLGEVVDYLEHNIGKDEIIGYIYSNRSYLFYGKKLNRKVLYVRSKGKNLSKWLEELYARGVRVIAVGPLHKEWESKQEIMWLKNPDGPFIRVFGENPKKEPTIYRIK